MAKTKSNLNSRRDESIGMQLLGAHAAVLTAVRCLENHGPLDHALAINLRRAALNQIEYALDGLGVPHG